MVARRWGPPDYTRQVARSLQALALYAQHGDHGNVAAPSPTDVKRTLEWIVETAAGTYDEPFVEGAPDTTSYLLGRRSVGLAIIKVMKVKPEMIQDEQ